MKINFYLFASAALLSSLALSGCASGKGAPTLLVQQNTNGSYTVTDTGVSTRDTVTLMTGSFASSPPQQESGAGYVSLATATLTTTAALPCPGVTFTLTGKVTNANVNAVLINLTGAAPGAGTLTLNGTVGNDPGQQLGQRIDGTFSIAGGSCTMPDTTFVAQR